MRELSFESSGHLYARECCANTWYAIGALHARRQRRAEAVTAFQQALKRGAKHPLAHLGLGVLEAGAPMPAAVAVSAPSFEVASSFEAAVGQAAVLVMSGDPQDAMRLVDHALSVAPPGNVGWLLPVEPLLNVASAPNTWAPALARLRTRAA